MVEIMLTLFGVPTVNVIRVVKAIRNNSGVFLNLRTVADAVGAARNTVFKNKKWVDTHSTVGTLKFQMSKGRMGSLFDALVENEVWFSLESEDGTIKLSSFIAPAEEPTVKTCSVSWLLNPA